MSENTIILEGHNIKIAASVAGPIDAPKVLLLHGGGQTRHSWNGAMNAISIAGYRVINIDLRGHGDSEWAKDGDYDVATMAQDLTNIIKNLDDDVAIVGASLGGICGMLSLASTNSPKIKALILVDVAAKLNPKGTNRILDFMRSHVNGFTNIEEAIAAVSEYNPNRPKTSSSNNGLMKNLRKGENGRLYWHWDPNFLNNKKIIALNRFDDLLNGSSGFASTPCLLVRGLKSDVVDEDSITHLKEIKPNLDVIDVHDAGHMVVGDKNDAFNSAVIEYLNNKLPLKLS